MLLVERLLSKVTCAWVPVQNPCVYCVFAVKVWPKTAGAGVLTGTAPTLRAPVPAKNGLFTGVVVCARLRVPVMVGSNWVLPFAPDFASSRLAWSSHGTYRSTAMARLFS